MTQLGRVMSKAVIIKHLQGRNRHKDIRMNNGYKEEEAWDRWEIGIDIYTLLCLKEKD